MLALYFQVRKKDQINVESKIKVVRFIGEHLLPSVLKAKDILKFSFKSWIALVLSLTKSLFEFDEQQAYKCGRP